MRLGGLRGRGHSAGAPVLFPVCLSCALRCSLGATCFPGDPAAAEAITGPHLARSPGPDPDKDVQRADSGLPACCQGSFVMPYFPDVMSPECSRSTGTL